MIGYVYKLTMDGCKAFYIGSTRNPKSRMSSHRTSLKRGNHDNYRIQEAWDKSGSKELTMEILFYGSMEDAEATELALLRGSADSPDLTNICVQQLKGVDYGRIKNPEEALKRRSAAAKGERNPMFGKTHTPEVRERLSKFFKGRPNPSARHPLSEETKRKLSISKRLNPLLGPKNPFYGKKHPPELLEHIRQKHIARYKKNAELGIPHAQAAGIEIDGVEYISQTAAAKALGVCNALITYRLKRPEKYPNYKSLKPASN